MQKITLLLPLLLMPAIAIAIVDTSNLHSQTPEDGLHGKVKVSLDKKSGNTEAESYATSAIVSNHIGKKTDYLILKTQYGTTSGVKSSQQNLAHIRRIISWKQDLDVEVFTQAESNPFTRLNYRALIGAGQRYRLYDEADKGVVIFGLGGFYLQEKIASGFADSGTDHLWRANSYLVLSFQIDPDITISSTTYFQPSIQNINDYRLLEDAAVEFKLSKSLALELSYHLVRDSKPPLGVKEGDHQFITTLNYSF